MKYEDLINTFEQSFNLAKGPFRVSCPLKM